MNKLDLKSVLCDVLMILFSNKASNQSMILEFEVLDQQSPVIVLVGSDFPFVY